MRKRLIIPIVIIFISFVAGALLYSYMPERMASHWNAVGEVDGYMPKFWGLFLMPLLSLAFFLLFQLIIKIDPLKENIKKFRNYYDGFIIAFTGFMFYIYILNILWNFNLNFNIIQFLSPAFALLFYYMGVLVKNSKRNWLIGIRTPWTLSSDRVWNKTHKIGGRMFKTVSFFPLFGIVFPRQAIFFVLPPIVFVVIYLFVYSYWEYRKESGK